MAADFATHRNAFREHERTRNLIDLVPKGDASVLDAGARDGRLSVLLADHFETVTALDQKKPAVRHRKVKTVQGDITSLRFPDNSFDCVMCTEVLEQVPGRLLERDRANRIGGRKGVSLSLITGYFMYWPWPQIRCLQMGCGPVKK